MSIYKYLTMCICLFGLISNMSYLYIIYFVKDGNTPLHYACLSRCKEIAVALLNRGADIHMKNNVSIKMKNNL